jgi:hypothetical protein
MADEYRSYLMNKYNLKEGLIDSLPVAAEIIGAVETLQHPAGIPMDLPFKLTSYAETQSIIQDLVGAGWESPQVKLAGWFNRGYEHYVPNGISLIGALGGKGAFKKLLEASTAMGASVYGEADFLNIYGANIFRGYVGFFDTIRMTNRREANYLPYSIVSWYQTRWNGENEYALANTRAVQRMTGNFHSDADKLGLENVAYKSMAQNLYGNYQRKAVVSREATMHTYEEILSARREAGYGVMLDGDNVYGLSGATFLTDLSLSSQNFSIADSSVPFYPMVLHGLVPYTGTAINLALDYTMDILNSAETGAGLYFSFMKASPSVLQSTEYKMFYSNEYDRWFSDAAALYQRFSTDFAGLWSQKITGHQILATGVTRTVYADGTAVYVNKTAYDWLDGGLSVPAMNYIVVRN